MTIIHREESACRHKQILRCYQLHRAKRTNLETKMRKSGPDQCGMRPRACKDRISKNRQREGRGPCEREIYPQQIARGIGQLDICTILVPQGGTV